MNNMGVIFLAATPMEVAGLLARRPCRENRGPGITLFYPDHRRWACLLTGPGVFNTAAGLSACLARETPDLVVDLGIAGVFAGSGLGIGDLALARSDTYRHTGVGEDGELPFDLIPGKAATREGRYDLCSRTLASCENALSSAGMGAVPSGAFLTVSAITASRKTAEAIFCQTPYLMESMEGAAAAHVCALYQVPMAEVRAGSNVTGDRDKSLWDVPAACTVLTRAALTLADAAADRVS